LIGVNIAVFTYSLASAGSSLFGQNPRFVDGAVSAEAVANGEPWRLVTAGFVHLNLVHLLSNLVVLWLIGQWIEGVVSRVQFALIYIVSLLGGSLGALLLAPGHATAGASGAIFGLLAGGSVVLTTRAGAASAGLVEVTAALLLGNLLFTFTKPGVSVGGHLGGACVGFLAGVLLSEAGPASRLGYRASAAAVAVVGVLVVGCSLLVASSSAA
jgi:membrane associated rhomboid family serine protease